MSSAIDASGLAPRWQAGLDEPTVALGALPGGALAVGGSEGTVLLLDAEGTILWSRRLDDALLALEASPDGTRIVALGTSSRVLYDADGRELAAGRAGWSSAASWDRRSSRAAVADGRHVRLLDRGGTVRWSSEALPSTVSGVLWPRGQKRVAAAAYQGVTILEPETDRVVKHLVAPGAISSIAAAPNGRWVVGGSQDATLHGWRVEDGTDFRMSGFPTTVGRLAFEQTGRWMACASAEVVTCWDFSGAGPTGRSAAVLQGHEAPVTDLAWASGDRRVLVTGDRSGNVLLWRLGRDAAPGATLRPAGGLRDEDPVTAVAVVDARPGTSVFIARRSGRLDATTLT